MARKLARASMSRHWAHDWLGLPLAGARKRRAEPAHNAAIGIMVTDSRTHPGAELAPKLWAFDFSLDCSRRIARTLRGAGYRVAVIEKGNPAGCRCWGKLGAPKCALYGANLRATVRRLRRFDFALEIAAAPSTDTEGGPLCIVSGSEPAWRFSRIFLDLIELSTGQPRQEPAILSVEDPAIAALGAEAIFAERSNVNAVTVELSPAPGQSLTSWYRDGAIVSYVANACAASLREAVPLQISPNL